MADINFIDYCRNLTDSQLEEVLAKEYARYKHGDYDNACVAAAERGWIMNKGQRQ